MNEYRCGECGSLYRGFEFDKFEWIISEHAKICEGPPKPTEYDDVSETRMIEVSYIDSMHPTSDADVRAAKEEFREWLAKHDQHVLDNQSK